MSTWPGTALFFLALVGSVAIRVPHDRRSQATAIKESRRGRLEQVLLGQLALAGLLLPVLYATTSVLSFADHAFPIWLFGLGVVAVVGWLWLFARAHRDLGTNWSATLEVRREHRLVTNGVYARIRHPMYTALFLHGAAQALLLANWVVGPAMLISFTLLFALRLGPEEQLMHDAFGDEWTAYRSRTKRLLPGVW